MTEKDWLKCHDPHYLLEHLKIECRATRRKSGQRKLRLFGCACCRRIQDRLGDERLRQAVVVAERVADGLASEAARKLAQGKARSAYQESEEYFVVVAAVEVLESTPWQAARAWASSSKRPDFEEQCLERKRQCGLLRCIFGNPFRPLPAIRSSAHTWSGWRSRSTRPSPTPAGTVTASLLTP
jgi:hypothetical protein